MEGLLDFSQLQGGTQIDLFEALDTQINGGSETPPGEQKDDIKATIKKDLKKDEEVALNVFDVLENKDSETEETNVVEDEVIKNTGKPPLQQNSKSSVPLVLGFKSLLEEGALTNFDEEEFNKEVEELGAATAFVNVMKKEADIARTSAREEVEADKKEVLSIYSGLLDAGVTSDVAKELVTNQIKFEQVKPEDLEAEEAQSLRVAIITQDLKNSTNFSDKKIKSTIQNYIDTGKDVEEAKESHVNVIEFNKEQIKLAAEQSKQKIAQEETQRKEIIKNYTEFIDKMDEPLPGIKANKQTKEKVKNSVLSGGLWETRKKDPIKFDSMVAYAIEAGLLDGKFDKIQAKAKTSVMKELDNILGTSKKSGGSPVMDIDDDKPDESMLSFLNKNKSKGF